MALHNVSTQMGKGQRAVGYTGRLAFDKGGKTMVGYYDPDEKGEEEDEMPLGRPAMMAMSPLKGEVAHIRIQGALRQMNSPASDTRT